MARPGTQNNTAHDPAHDERHRKTVPQALLHQRADKILLRCSPSIFSTLLRPPRPRSTSLRYGSSISSPTRKTSTDSCHQTLVPAPRSFFMDVKCPGCFTITTVFSHAQTVVICQGCTTVLCQPTGGKARLTEGCSFRRK